MLLRIGVLASNSVSGMVDDTTLMFLDLLFVEKQNKTKKKGARSGIHCTRSYECPSLTYSHLVCLFMNSVSL